jgi:hypothetical protein
MRQARMQHTLVIVVSCISLLAQQTRFAYLYFVSAAGCCWCVQIDLSDDYLLLTLFADGDWEEQTQPIQLGDGDRLEPLQVDEQQFKDFVGMIKTLQVGTRRASHMQVVSACTTVHGCGELVLWAACCSLYFELQITYSNLCVPCGVVAAAAVYMLLVKHCVEIRCCFLLEVQDPSKSVHIHALCH